MILVAPYRAILRYYRCDTPYCSIPSQGVIQVSIAPIILRDGTGAVQFPEFLPETPSRTGGMA